ncbi:hypothetical protein Tsubulata_006191, partial [Turnera subulata]
VQSPSATYVCSFRTDLRWIIFSSINTTVFRCGEALSVKTLNGLDPCTEEKLVRMLSDNDFSFYGDSLTKSMTSFDLPNFPVGKPEAISGAGKVQCDMEYNETGCQTNLGASKPCANGCVLYGTVATKNLCSKCRGDSVLNQEQQREHASFFTGSVDNRSSNNNNIDIWNKSVVSDPQASSGETLTSASSTESPKRCSTCKKRVGLTGFSCRCGNLFCGTHRYSDRHGCSYDYRTAARSAIAKANPTVRAQKLNKI